MFTPDKSCPAHSYYRWRLFSVLQGTYFYKLFLSYISQILVMKKLTSHIRVKYEIFVFIASNQVNWLNLLQNKT